MSDNVCPKCGKPYTYVGDVFGDPRDFVCQCYLSERPQIWYKISNDSANLYSTISDLQSEIARLKAELEKAESERDEARLNAQCWNKDSDMWETQAEEWETYSRKALEQRDEARRWARKYYRLYLIERQNYLDTFTDGDEWDEV